MSVVRLNFTAEELNILKSYADNRDLSVLIKAIVFKHISDEDKYDKQEFEKYEHEVANGKVKTYSHEEAWREIESCYPIGVSKK